MDLLRLFIPGGPWVEFGICLPLVSFPAFSPVDPWKLGMSPEGFLGYLGLARESWIPGYPWEGLEESPGFLGHDVTPAMEESSESTPGHLQRVFPLENWDGGMGETALGICFQAWLF